MERMTTNLLVLVAFCSIIKVALFIGDEDILCTSRSCKSAECPKLPEKCSGNDTDAFVSMLSPDICNCCEYCLVNIAEGDPCTIGDPSNAKHTSICGPGLACTVAKQGDTDGTCQKMTTTCTLKQKDYDDRRASGALGTMETRATCEADGLFGTYKCIPGQNCYCLHSNGSRIFGEAAFSTIPNYMSCSCSRAYYDAADILGRPLHPHEHFRCSADGSYDRVQCINSRCLCVDASDGTPTYPGASLVNISQINFVNLPCFEGKEGEYYRKCEKQYMQVHQEVMQKINESGYSLVLGYEYPKCDVDGTYAAVQENRTHKYCVDKEGTILTTALDKSNSSELIDSMNCKCARASLIMTTQEKPQCLENGNYASTQIRRGTYRCVDEDGNQLCTDGLCEGDDPSKLSCLR